MGTPQSCKSRSNPIAQSKEYMHKMADSDQTKSHNGIYYIVFSFVLWMIVEYVTVWHSKLAEWVSLMPYAQIQYLVIVLSFWYFIFRRRWSERKIFVLMVVVMYVFEFLWTNPFLLNHLTFIPGSFLLTSIWGFLTFIPLWLVRRELRHRKIRAALCLLWMPVGFILAIILG